MDKCWQEASKSNTVNCENILHIADSYLLHPSDAVCVSAHQALVDSVARLEGIQFLR